MDINTKVLFSHFVVIRFKKNVGELWDGQLYNWKNCYTALLCLLCKQNVISLFNLQCMSGKKGVHSSLITGNNLELATVFDFDNN